MLCLSASVGRKLLIGFRQHFFNKMAAVGGGALYLCPGAHCLIIGPWLESYF